MEKDINNILAYFGLNSRIENNEIHISDNTGLEYDIYECTIDPFMVPKKLNNVDTIFRFGSCHILAVPNGTSIQESDVLYDISMNYQDDELVSFNVLKHQRSNQDKNNIATTEISFNKDKFIGINDAFIKEFINNQCRTLYVMDEQKNNLSYRTIDVEGKTSEFFNIQYVDNGAIISSHINEIANKETALSCFEKSHLFQKILNDYFPKLNEQCYQLKTGNIEYSINNNMHSSQNSGRAY